MNVKRMELQGLNLPDKRIVDFSMEIVLDPAMATHSGGLDILAGDTLRAAAQQGPK